MKSAQRVFNEPLPPVDTSAYRLSWSLTKLRPLSKDNRLGTRGHLLQKLVVDITFWNLYGGELRVRVYDLGGVFWPKAGFFRFFRISLTELINQVREAGVDVPFLGPFWREIERRIALEISASEIFGESN